MIQQIVNALLSKTATKIAMVLVLLGTWIALTVAKMIYPALDTAPIITTIQLALGGLGVAHLQSIVDGQKDADSTDTPETPSQSTDKAAS